MQSSPRVVQLQLCEVDETVSKCEEPSASGDDVFLDAPGQISGVAREELHLDLLSRMTQGEFQRLLDAEKACIESKLAEIRQQLLCDLERVLQQAKDSTREALSALSRNLAAAKAPAAVGCDFTDNCCSRCSLPCPLTKGEERADASGGGLSQDTDGGPDTEGSQSLDPPSPAAKLPVKPQLSAGSFHLERLHRSSLAKCARLLGVQACGSKTELMVKVLAGIEKHHQQKRHGVWRTGSHPESRAMHTTAGPGSCCTRRR